MIVMVVMIWGDGSDVHADADADDGDDNMEGCHWAPQAAPGYTWQRHYIWFSSDQSPVVESVGDSCLAQALLRGHQQLVFLRL